MLFSIENDRLQPLQPLVASEIGWNEKKLENILASHLDRLILSMNLMVIQQERVRQPEVDILALSDDGTLFLLELKVLGAGEEAVIQVIRYAQNYGLYSYDKLQSIYRTYTRNLTADL